MKNEIWIEKYRPKNFNEVVGQNTSEIEKHLSNIPHFLFLSKSPGTGKTTIAKIIIKKLQSDYIQLNASDERGIDTIRNKVKDFAMTMSSNGKIKIIFFDEADYLTREAQTALRNMMETYAKNCRFILTGNYENKIIEPIRSRCVVIKFQEPKKEEIYPYLEKININEKLGLLKDELIQLIDKCYPDIRKMVNRLQMFNLTNDKNSLIKSEDIEVAKALWIQIKSLNFWKCREIILNSQFDPEDILIDIHQLIIKDKLNDELKFKLLIELAETMKYMNIVINKEILLESMIIKMIEVLK